ncbi:MAG: SDR family NAD(P)-dependent oxidoreductase [Christensenellaceae bacterium]
MKVIIITGASSGMGREFARLLDQEQNFDEFWLIARNMERLTALQQELRHPSKAYSLDLQHPESISIDYAHLLETEKPEVQILVNGSGYGKFDKFEDVSLEENLGMIDLNCRALTAITYLTLPYMAKDSHIVNIDSMSAFQPIPYINVYAATKAYVLSFSRALNVELKQRRIHVMAFCPYWVNTNFFDGANKHKTIRYFDKIYEPDQVVKKGVKAMKKGKDVCIPGATARRIQHLTKILPHSLVMKVWMKQQHLS